MGSRCRTGCRPPRAVRRVGVSDWRGLDGGGALEPSRRDRTLRALGFGCASGPRPDRRPGGGSVGCAGCRDQPHGGGPPDVACRNRSRGAGDPAGGIVLRICRWRRGCAGRSRWGRRRAFFTRSAGYRRTAGPVLCGRAAADHGRRRRRRPVRSRFRAARPQRHPAPDTVRAVAASGRSARSRPGAAAG